jgi:Flp pilus assembly protein TadG
MPQARYRKLGKTLRMYPAVQGGAAAAEFALVLLFLVVPILNVVDVGIYTYDRMELDNAAQIAVQTAWAECASSGKIPATVNNYCAGVTSAMTSAAQTTSMGSNVSVSSVSEDYCCPSSTGVTCQGAVATTTPTNCASGLAPGDYIFATVSYSYSPLYSGVSVASLLTSPITRTAWMRLG